MGLEFWCHNYTVWALKTGCDTTLIPMYNSVGARPQLVLTFLSVVSLLLWHQRDSFSTIWSFVITTTSWKRERQITLTCSGAARDSASVEITQSNVSCNQQTKAQFMSARQSQMLKVVNGQKKLKLLRKEIQIISTFVSYSVRYERHLALPSTATENDWGVHE